MKYRNASEILPDELLKQLQQYASGELLYVPSEGRKKWGTGTGARRFYQQRNDEIRHKHFHQKVPIGDLCEEYSLSDETVRKILFR